MSYIGIKRLLDFIIAILLLIVFLPVLIVVSILIKRDSKGPIFFLQERIGMNGEPFNIIKFRSMYVNNGELKTSVDDLRITRIGKKIRKASIDELPQIINIIQGNMSFIGPRPDVYKNYSKYNDLQKYKLKVKPGISGLSQVKGRSNLTIDEKYKYDRYYVDHISFSLDIRIVIQTIIIILTGKGVN